MKLVPKILIVAALAVAIAGVAAWKIQEKNAPGPSKPAIEETQAADQVQPTPTPAMTAAAAVTPAPKALPKLLDLGADKCIPCKMMAPILEELRETYAGQMEVMFIDVWKEPEAGKAYGVSTIPTQIFYDAEGKERFRHVGFFSREDILAKCDEFGFGLAEPAAAGSQPGENE